MVENHPGEQNSGISLEGVGSSCCPVLELILGPHRSLAIAAVAAFISSIVACIDATSPASFCLSD